MYFGNVSSLQFNVSICCMYAFVIIYIFLFQFIYFFEIKDDCFVYLYLSLIDLRNLLDPWW